MNDCSYTDRSVIHVAEIRGDGYYVALHTPKQNKAWLLRKEGKTLKEIGDAMGVTGAMARVNIFHAERKFIKQTLFCE